MSVKVLIIGGGVIGLSIARELHKKGVRDVTIVDRGVLGGEASWAAAGMLAPNAEAENVDDLHRFCTASLELYPDFAEELFNETGIDIELDRSGTLYLAFNATDVDHLRERFAQQSAAGLAVEQLSAVDVRRAEPFISTEVRAGLFYSNDWQVENRKLVEALRKFAESGGIRVIENAEVSELLTDGSRVTGARTSAGEIRADATVIATGAWTSLIQIGDARLPIDVKPIRGQMIGFETDERELRRVIYSPRGYIVPRNGGRVLAGATVEDVGFDKAVTDDAVESLKAAAFEIAPELRGFDISESWAGLRPFAADGLPVIGELPGYENVFVATAHYRNGILLAPKTAQIIADRIVDGADSEFLKLFSAERTAASSNAAAN